MDCASWIAAIEITVTCIADEYTFDDGTFQGWKVLSGRGVYTVRTLHEASYLSLSSPAVLPRTFSARNLPHETVVVRSPPFRISANLTISARMLGGTGAAATTPAAPHLLPDVYVLLSA